MTTRKACHRPISMLDQFQLDLPNPSGALLCVLVTVFTGLSDEHLHQQLTERCMPRRATAALLQLGLGRVNELLPFTIGVATKPDPSTQRSVFVPSVTPFVEHYKAHRHIFYLQAVYVVNVWSQPDGVAVVGSRWSQV